MYGDKRSLRSIRPTRATTSLAASVDPTDALYMPIDDSAVAHRASTRSPPCISDRDPRDHDLQVGSVEAHPTRSRPCGHFPLRCAGAAGTASNLINALASL